MKGTNIMPTLTEESAVRQMREAMSQPYFRAAPQRSFCVRS